MRRLATTTPVLVSFVLLAAVWVTNARTVPFFTGGPGTDPSKPSGPNEEQLGPGSQIRPPRHGDPDAGLGMFHLFGYLTLGTLVLALLAFVVSASVGNRRAPRKHLVEAELAAGAVDASTVPSILVETAEQQLAAIRQGTPRNAIVACWWELERSSQATGLARAASETSSEFTQRVLARYLVGRSSIEGLAELYREARFSAHVMTEDDRDRAVTALQEILSELQAARSRPPAAVAG